MTNHYLNNGSGFIMDTREKKRKPICLLNGKMIRAIPLLKKRFFMQYHNSYLSMQVLTAAKQTAHHSKEP